MIHTKKVFEDKVFVHPFVDITRRVKIIHRLSILSIIDYFWIHDWNMSINISVIATCSLYNVIQEMLWRYFSLNQRKNKILFILILGIDFCPNYPSRYISLLKENSRIISFVAHRERFYDNFVRQKIKKRKTLYAVWYTTTVMYVHYFL